MDLPVWQALHEELAPRGFVVITVAMDSGGAADARPGARTARGAEPGARTRSGVLPARYGAGGAGQGGGRAGGVRGGEGAPARELEFQAAGVASRGAGEVGRRGILGRGEGARRSS